MPCCSMGGMVRVTSVVWPPCVRSLDPRQRLGRGGVCARAQGGQARRNLRPRPRGRARRSLCPSLEGSDKTELVPEPGKFGHFALFLFAIFITLIWVSRFMVPNTILALIQLLLLVLLILLASKTLILFTEVMPTV